MIFDKESCESEGCTGMKGHGETIRCMAMG